MSIGETPMSAHQGGTTSELASESPQSGRHEQVGVESTSSIARTSIIWNTAFNIFRDVVQFAQTIVLARLVLPEAYGQFALATSVIGLLSILTLKNFSAHTLQVANDSEAHFQDHFTSGIVLQLGAFFVANLVGFGVRFAPDYQQLAMPIHVLSFTFLLEWPTEIRLRMLERAFDWRRRRLLHGAGISLSLFVAILMAVAGMGVYALVVPGMLVAIPFIYDLFVFAEFRPTWTWSWDNYKEAFRFALTRIGAGLSTTGRQLLENATFASLLGFASLGLVNRAVGLSQLVCGRIASQLLQAVYPILTRLESETGQAALAGDLLIRVVSWIAWPIAICVGALALPAIATVYGSQWLEAAGYMRWTLACTVMMALMQVAYALLLARQQARLCLLADFAVLIGTGCCLLLLLQRGVNYYFAGITVTYGATLCFLAYFLLRFSAITKRGLLRAIGPPVVACVVATGISIAVLSADAFGQTDFLPAFCWGSSFLVLYIAVLRIAFASSLRELIGYFPARRSFYRVLWLSP